MKQNGPTSLEFNADSVTNFEKKSFLASSSNLSMKASSAGFTLIELLVVIAIIGILAMVIFINVVASRAKARDSRRVQDMHNIQTALEVYNTDCGQYPATWSVGENTGCASPTTLGTFLPVLPADPQPGQSYTYAYDDTTNIYTLVFTLENSVNAIPAGAHTLYPDGIH